MERGEIQTKADELVAEHGRGIEWAGRLGFATKGVVYGVVGTLAISAAWGGGRAEGSDGAVRTLGEQPLGNVLRWSIAVGLEAYAVWRFVQAAVDPQFRATGWKAWLRRSGYALCGLFYTALAIYTAPLALIPWGRDSHRGLVARVFAWPGGQMLVAAAGLAIIGFAGFEMYLAITRRFMRQYQVHKMNRAEQITAKVAGIAGLAARSVTFSIVGGCGILAAVRLNPAETRSMGEALQLLARQVYGPWLLAIVGVGLVGYAIYCETLAFYQRFAVRALKQHVRRTDR